MKYFSAASAAGPRAQVPAARLPANGLCFGLGLSGWTFTVPMESHGRLASWHSSNATRLNTHLGVVPEAPSALTFWYLR